jgi:hypothetical protein
MFQPLQTTFFVPLRPFEVAAAIESATDRIADAVRLFGLRPLQFSRIGTRVFGFTSDTAPNSLVIDLEPRSPLDPLAPGAKVSISAHDSEGAGSSIAIVAILQTDQDP